MHIPCLLYSLIAINLVNSINFEIIIKKLLNEIQPSHVTLHDGLEMKKPIDNLNYQEFLKVLLNQVQTSIINLINHPGYLNYNPIVVEYNKNVTAPLHVILLTEDSEGKFFQLLETS